MENINIIFGGKNTIVARLVLAILLLLCLLKMPYGYYQFVRYSTCLFFGYFGILSLKYPTVNYSFLFFSLAILFQPFYKISLGRVGWNLVDVIVAVGLLLSIYADFKKTDNNKAN